MDSAQVGSLTVTEISLVIALVGKRGVGWAVQMSACQDRNAGSFF